MDDAGTLVRAGADSSTTIRVLTRFELWSDGRPVDLPLTAQRVLAFLAVRGPSERRVTISGVLWADTSEVRAAANLRTVLWKLRRCGRDLVRVTRTHVELGPGVDTDLARLVAQARRLVKRDGLGEVDTDIEPLARDLLVSWDEEWLTFERERLRQLRLHALESLSRQLTAAGRHGEAVEAALTAVASEPLRESSQRALIAAHLGEGNRNEAVQQYESFCRLLWSDLGVAPSPELEELVSAPLDRRLAPIGTGAMAP